MTLTDTQIDYILDDVRRRGLLYAPLVDELVDHLCCGVEREMAAGLDFETAYQAVLSGFGADGLQRTEAQTLHALTFKSQLMKRLFYSAAGMAASLLFVTTLAVQAQHAPSLLPVQHDHLQRVSAPFGRTILAGTPQEKVHQGVDLVVPVGTPVRATADGVIALLETDDAGYGLFIRVQHDSVYTTQYSHLSEFLVEPGQSVAKGDVIGYSGNSGLSTGPHLHYEVYREGKRVDPAAYYELD